MNGQMLINKPFASLIISAYKNDKYLRFVLESVKQQSDKRFEVIISEDAEHAHMQDFIGKLIFPIPLKHITQPDKGWQKNRALNRAIEAASTDYFVFIDEDCMLHPRFMEFHIKFSEEGYFLSGGAIRLPKDLSKKINEELIKSQVAFSRKWLLNNGLDVVFKSSKLIRKRGFSPFMKFITTAKATWNGGNASGWKKDFIDINGFNEDLLYGGQDREFGQRLQNLGVKSKQIRYSAVCLHLDHSRPYKSTDSITKNYKARKTARKTRETRTQNGLDKWISTSTN